MVRWGQLSFDQKWGNIFIFIVSSQDTKISMCVYVCIQILFLMIILQINNFLCDNFPS